MQKGRPIAFESRKLTPIERTFSVYDKEMLAIMYTLTKFKQYLVCGKFIVRSDHNSLKYFLEQQELNDRQQKWVTKLQSYDFEIEFIKRKKNSAADALSRTPIFHSMSIITADWKANIMADYDKNEWTTKLISGDVKDDRYSVHDGLIFYKNRVYITTDSMLKGETY